MKIRDRLALFVTLAAAGILLLLCLIIYFAAASHRRHHFFAELQEEVRLRGERLHEQQSLFSAADQPVQVLSPEPGRRKAGNMLLHLRKQEGARDSLKAIFPPDFVETLFRDGYAEFQANRQEGVAQIFSQDGESYAVISAAHDRHGRAQLHKLKILLGIAFFLGVLLFYLVGRLSARHILKPISGKIQKARHISASNLHLRLNVYNQKDEMGQLAIAFNEMLDRLESAFEMQRNFISNASHEIRNPLTAIIGETEVCLARRRSPDEYIESLHNIAREADRLDALVNNLLSLAKAGYDETALVREETRLDDVLLEARGNAHKAYPGNRIRLDFSALPQNPDWITIQGNANLLKVAFSNLMENACKFSGRQEEVLVKLTASEKNIELRIIDKGVGIPPQEVKKIFQPFYRARNARSYKGFGIGLSLTDKIIRLHKGELQILSEEGKGTTMAISFEK